MAAYELVERLPIIPYGFQVAIHLPMPAYGAFAVFPDRVKYRDSTKCANLNVRVDWILKIRLPLIVW